MLKPNMSMFILASCIMIWSACAQTQIKPPKLANPYAMRIAVDGQRLYAAVGTGVMVFDISEPSKPKQIGFVPAFLACDVKANNGVLFVACLYNGLKIFRIMADKGLKFEELTTVPRNARRIATDGEWLIVTSGEKLPDDVWGGGNANLDVIDVKDPAKPKLLGTCPLSGMLYGIAVREKKCFVANDDRGVSVIDIAEPMRPKVIGKIAARWAYNCEFDQKGRLIIAQGAGDPLLISELSDLKSEPKTMRGLTGYSVKIVHDDIAIVAGVKGMTIAKIGDPEKPNVLAKVEFPGNSIDVEVIGEFAFVANGSHGIRIIDIKDTANPKQVALIQIGGMNHEEAQKLPIKEQPKDALWLRVRGNAIVDGRGQPYRLVAVGYPMVNLMWCEPLMRYRLGDIEGICSYLRSLGVNAIRLAFSPPFTDYMASVVPSPAHRYSTAEEFVEHELLPTVRRIESCGLYVVLDMHGAHDYSTLFGWVRQAWRAIAQRFSDDPYIAWYELWQEPYFYPKEAKEAGMEPSRTRKQHLPGQRLYYMDTIREIRKFDKRHIVMVEDYGPWWWVAEEQWSAVNFRIDPGFDSAIFAKRAAYGNGFSEAFRKYVTGLMDKWQVPFCLAEIETGHRYNKPEDWFYFIYGWLANEERTIPLQFWAINDVEVMMADLWAPFVKRWASPPPPPKMMPEPKVYQRVVLDAPKAEGGKKTTVKSDGASATAVFIPADEPVGSNYTFRLPKPLPVGKYRVTVRLFSDGKPSFPQAIVYIDKNGWQYPPDSALGSWGEDHFYIVNRHIIPQFLYTHGWVQWQTIWEPLSEIVALQVRKVKGVPYLSDCERPNADTRPISQIVIEAIAGD